MFCYSYALLHCKQSWIYHFFLKAYINFPPSPKKEQNLVTTHENIILAPVVTIGTYHCHKDISQPSTLWNEIILVPLLKLMMPSVKVNVEDDN